MTQQYDNWFTDSDELGTETGLGDRDSGEVGRALQPVAEFAKWRTASAWPHLVRAKVAAGLADRLTVFMRSHPSATVGAGFGLTALATVRATAAGKLL